MKNVRFNCLASQTKQKSASSIKLGIMKDLSVTSMTPFYCLRATPSSGAVCCLVAFSAVLFCTLIPF